MQFHCQLVLDPVGTKRLFPEREQSGHLVLRLDVALNVLAFLPLELI